MILGLKGQNNTTLYGRIKAYRFTKKGNDAYPTATIKDDRDAQRIIASDERVFIVKEGFAVLPADVKHSKLGRPPKDDKGKEAAKK